MNTYNFGERLRLNITAEGFSLWDMEHRRWIIDASCVRDDKEISIASNVRQLKKGLSKSRIFRAQYPGNVRFKK